MKYSRNEDVEKVLLREMMAEIADERSHPSVTDLIYCLTKSFYNASKPVKPDETRKVQLFFTTGLGLEKALLVGRQGEKKSGVTEGIHWHVDSLNGVNTPLMELKTTRTSMKTPFEEINPRWWKQAMAYCKATGQTKMEFVVLYVIPPELMAYDVEFEQSEIDENWNWLQSRKAVWDQALADGTWPEEYKYNEPWECKECVYAMVCEARSTARRI